MAKGKGRVRFFFQYAYQQTNSLINFVRERFKNLYQGSGGGDKEAIRRHLSVHFQEQAESRFIQNIRVAEHSKPLGIPFSKFTFVEWHLLREDIELQSKKSD